MDDYSMYVPKVHYELIPIKNLVSNQEYQRVLSTNQVQKVAANFDVFQINPVKVSRRNGINYVFNGQHTIETVALVSGSRETPVWCMIYDDLDYEHEADIFENKKKLEAMRKNLKKYEEGDRIKSHSLIRSPCLFIDYTKSTRPFTSSSTALAIELDT